MKNSFFSILIFLILAPIQIFAQDEEDVFELEPVRIDSSIVDVFSDVKNAKLKIDYYHTDGYSTNDRYWYEVIIIDSLMILNFNSPQNDDWNYINYQKKIILNENQILKIKNKITDSKLKKKIKGIPLPEGSGYGADRLFLEMDNLKIAGGTVYMWIGEEMTVKEFEEKVKKEKAHSSTISGDYQAVFDLLEELFTDLPFLLESMWKK